MIWDISIKLKQYLVKGNNITLFLLNQLFPKETNWEYISLSLEKLEFPFEISGS
jgi:hypothetical protein